MGNLQYVLIALIVFGLDRISKFLAAIGYQGGHPVFFRNGFFSLRYVKNSGGAFGLFPRKGYLFLLVTMIAVGLLVYLLFFSGLQQTVTKVGLAFLLGGSLGNLMDRILSGAVIDFIQVWRAPIFNLADVAIVTGAGLVVLMLAGGSRFIGQ
ncbi:signal peptidase II [Candidatus Bipolaricaulota bacterium]|nr:signal peptidase II [Candidatus Bipolaricaulota bacterium]